VFPFRVLGVRRRPDGVRAHVAECARHADSVWTDEILVGVVRRVVVETVGVPTLSRALVEIRVWEEPKPDDAGRLAVVGADGHGLSPRADRDPRIVLRARERILGALSIANIEPEPEAIRIRPGRLAETWFVHESQVPKAVVAAVSDPRVRGDGLEEIEAAEAVDREAIP